MPAAKFGTSKQRVETPTGVMRVPGPGTHEVKTSIGSGGNQIIGQRLRGGGSMDLGTGYVPGPGTYSPNKAVWDPQI